MCASRKKLRTLSVVLENLESRAFREVAVAASIVISTSLLCVLRQLRNNSQKKNGMNMHAAASANWRKVQVEAAKKCHEIKSIIKELELT
ncbi:unnamed protein product [Sphagnum tenellum]